MSSSGQKGKKRSERKKPFLSEAAVSGVVLILILGLIGCITIWIISGPVEDTVLGFHRNATSGAHATLPLSQERQNAIWYTQIAYDDYPLIIFILACIGATVAALNWRTKQV